MLPSRTLGGVRFLSGLGQKSTLYDDGPTLCGPGKTSLRLKDIYKITAVLQRVFSFPRGEH